MEKQLANSQLLQHWDAAGECFSVIGDGMEYLKRK